MTHFERLCVVAVGFLVGISGAVAASEHDAALQALDSAIATRNSAVTAFSQRDFRSVSQDALNEVVRQGVSALRERGESSLALAWERDWQRRFSSSLTELGTLDLGDHKPLSKWLADFYQILEDRFGGDVAHSGLLGDIYQLNYAIPVTFAPQGDWWKSRSDTQDVREYRAHFVPFASIVTYYGVLVVCQQVMKKQGQADAAKRVCKPAAQKLREAMNGNLAPLISDFIYLKANGANPSLSIQPQDWVYTRAEDLLN